MEARLKNPNYCSYSYVVIVIGRFDFKPISCGGPIKRFISKNGLSEFRDDYFWTVFINEPTIFEAQLVFSEKEKYFDRHYNVSCSRPSHDPTSKNPSKYA